jgi:DNA polymerase III alpha subunit
VSYVALHNHSYYSLLDGVMAVEEIVEAAVQYEMPAVGLTDRDSLAGAVQFYKKAKAAGIHPVIGSQVTLASGGSLVLLALPPSLREAVLHKRRALSRLGLCSAPSQRDVTIVRHAERLTAAPCSRRLPGQ